MLGRSLLILLLIVVLSVGGIFWFDYLNVIDAKDLLAPVYRFIPFAPGEGRTQPRVDPDDILNLDAERLAIRLEALELRNMEMSLLRDEMNTEHDELMRMAEEMEIRQKALEDWEKSLNAASLDAENRDRNIEQDARYLTGMAPQSAVDIIAEMEDQLAIDVIRKTEEIAQAEGTQSIVSFWFSLMDPVRAAELQRKMAARPPGF